ncbi:MAG TPA: tetratricopeptide repeat protein [Rhizomicrobium sp.]|nr:tetratricopeptide repeat protein [Rhizomicrobium sp.]
MVPRVVGTTLSIVLLSFSAQAGWFGGSSSTSSPTASDAAAAQVQSAIDDQRYVDAAATLDEALLVDGGNPKLVFLSGELALARGRNGAALGAFKSVDTDPALRARALEGEGIALSLLGKSDAAITALVSAVSLDPKAWRAWNALGAQYDRLHDWPKAEAAYEHALAASDSAAIVLNNRGYSRLCQNRLDDAVKDFVAALQKKPDLATARNNLRLAIAMKGEYDRAMEGTTAADRAAVLNNIGFAAMMRGDYGEAKKMFDQAIGNGGKYNALAAANLEMNSDLESGRAKNPADAFSDTH